MKTNPYLFLLLCMLLLSSCYTGHTYHHSRTSIEPSVSTREIPLIAVPVVKNAPITIKESIAVKDTIRSVVQPVHIQQKYSAKKTEVHAMHPVAKPRLKMHYQLRKVTDTKGKIDELADGFIIIYFLFIGLPSILLLVAGFIMGCFGIMVGFWICWVLGTVGVLSSAIIFIASWITLGNDTRPLAITSAVVYLLFVLAAIAFILIVLL